MIADWLFKLDPADQPLLEQWCAVRQSVAAAVTLSTTVDAPSDANLLLTNVCCNLGPGAGQTADRVQIQLTNNLTFSGVSNPDLVYIDFKRPAGPAGNAAGESRNVNIWIPARSQFGLFAVFSAGGVANLCTWTLMGLKFPRGNFRPTSA